MKIFSAVLLVDRATRAERTKLKATCDISHLFQGSETIYNVKCENDIGNNYSENRQILRLYENAESNETETIRCIVSCKYDLEQKAKIVIRAAVDENGQCVVITPKKLDGLCGTGCTNDVIKEKMGQTLTRHSCTNNSYNDLVQPGEECQFTCQTDDGDFINAEEKLRCTCNDGKSGTRECDWTIGKVKPIDALNKDGFHILPTVMGTRDDGQECGTHIDCADDEYLSLTHPDYLYGNMLDYYMADPEEYGFNLQCVKRQCGNIPLDDLICFDKDGNQLDGPHYPEGSRCGRKCNQTGFGYDHTPTDELAGKDKYTHTAGGHGKYNFVPASDAVCSCGHQYSWPRNTHDYYGQFYPDEYYGSYCEWNYGSGPLAEYEPIVKKSLQPQPEQMGDGIQAAQYLASCKPNFCNTDMIADAGVKSYILNHLETIYSDYGTSHENGFQNVKYTINGKEFEYGFTELWNFRDITCPDEDKFEDDASMVKLGTQCSLSCKPGYMWLPNDDRNDVVECIGMFSTFGVGGWDWMPAQWHPGYGSPRLDLRVCVPNNYLDRDHAPVHQTL